MHSNCGYVSLVFARPTFIQKTVLLDRLIMAEAGDFFPDQSFGHVSEGIDAAMPSSDLLDEGVPATTKVKRSLRRSRAGYQGFLTKLYKEMEFLLLHKWNVELVNNKLKVVHAAFINYDRAHAVYLESLDDTEEIQRATLEYESRLKEKFEFFQRVDQWMASSLPSLNVQIPSMEDDIRPRDSVSHHGTSATKGSQRSSSRLSVKIKEAKVEKAVAELRLQQLKKKLELQERCDALLRRQELLDAENDIEAAALKARILEHDIGNASISAPSFKNLCVEQKSSMAEQKETFPPSATRPLEELPTPAKHRMLNPNAPEWFAKPSDRDFHQSDGSLGQFVQQQQQLMELHQQAFQSMASTIRQGFTLPKPELSPFNGNPLQFWSFMRSFENNIEKNTQDECERLTFLLQYCTGAAKNAIKSCVTMDPAIGYKTARKLLKDRFGHPFKIATAHVNQVTRGPAVKPNDQRGLQTFADQLKDCQNVLESIGYLDEVNSADNLRNIIDRLPFHLKAKWLEVADSIQESGQRPRINNISKFVSDKAQAANNPIFGGALNSDKDKSNRDRSGRRTSPSHTMASSHATHGNFSGPGSCVPNPSENQNRQFTSRRRRSGKCLLCDELHQLWNCEQFKTKSFEDRMKIIRDGRLCDNCFKVGHFASGCMQKSGCYIEGCNGKHMTVIHPPERSLPARQETNETHGMKNNEAHPSNQSNARESAEHAIQNHAIGAGVRNSGRNISAPGRKVRLRIVPVRVQGKQLGQVVETYALLDNGSDVSLCEEKLIDELGISGVQRHFSLTTQEKKDSPRSGYEVKLIINSIDNESSLEVPKVWTVERLNISELSNPRELDVGGWPHLKGIELPEIDIKEIRVVIGCNVPEAFWVLEEKCGGKGEPVGIRSPLGWTVIGPTEKIGHEDSFNVNFLRLETQDDDEKLSQQVEKFWKTDFVDLISSSKVSMSVEDERALRIMEGSSKKVSGHYQIALPWRQQPPYLPNNRVLADHRLQLLKKKFLQDHKLFESYRATIHDYISKGYAQRVPKEELDIDDKPLWYLPHHAVFNPNKPGKLRVVFDCAARYSGTSLNDQLLSGPDLTNSLFGVLVRFRQEPVALSSDIEAMFHQIMVDPKDVDALRFLWWPDDDLSKRPVEYRMTVHLFGSTSSPSCASFGLRKTAQDNAGDFSHEVIDTMLRNFYVDDCLKSVKSTEVAVELRKDLCALLSRGGFRLTKWLCNRKEVLETIPTSARAPSVLDLDLNSNLLPTERTLGVQWNMNSDMFTFKMTPKDKPFTRRGILSVTSSIYDPLGMVSPIILPVKRLLQDLCKQGLGWDEEIGAQESQCWRLWLSDLPLLSSVALPRCLRPVDLGQIQDAELHHFADASQIAYGTVSYARLVDENGRTHCSFLAAKSRLAHMKQMTIPRLELSAAVLAV